jgi:hypothetical protein
MMFPPSATFVIEAARRSGRGTGFAPEAVAPRGRTRPRTLESPFVGGTRAEVQSDLPPRVRDLGCPWRIFAWERTASACSNAQYTSARPSEARIALTWTLEAILVATGFASRVALRRRFRRAYVPLLLVVVAVGVTAFWLLADHSPWGVGR